MKKLLILALLCLGLLSAAAASGEPAPPQTGSIVRTYSAGDCANQCWVCNGPVQLDSVTVTVDTSDARVDAVRLAPGCTGSIGRLDILTFSADGMKVAEGVHDLTIGGGTVYCRAKVPDPNVHQDGIQVMGGNAITFTGLTIDCGRGDEPKIDANLFISQGSNSTTPPTDVVCDRCWLGPAAAHTVNMNVSVRSGVKRSTVCPAKYAGLALTVNVGTLDLVNLRNTLPAACSHAWFHWDGFDAPVKNTDTGKLNQVKAGDLVNFGFGLGREWGLDVFAVGYPTSVPIACPFGAIERKLAAAPYGSAAGLSMSSGRYVYGWQTDPSWAGTCRRFQLLLDGDAAPHTADVKFK